MFFYLLHFRDGCQKCGLYVASHNLLDMAEREQEIDVFDTVHQVRLTRPQFITDLVKSLSGLLMQFSYAKWFLEIKMEIQYSV